MKKILPFLVICFLAGLLLGRSLDILHQRHFFSAAILILITFFISAAISISRANIFFILICLLFFILGILRYTSFVFPREDDVCFSLNEDPQTVVICGAVEGGIKEKNKEDKIEFLFRAEHILVDDKEKPVSGTICVKTFSLKENIYIGDRLIVEGKANRPPGLKNPVGFDYEKYLKTKGVYSVMTVPGNGYIRKVSREEGFVVTFCRILSVIRNKLDKILKTYFSGDTLQVMRSTTLGLRSGLRDELNDTFVKTGTKHIFAISGLHVGIVAAAIAGLLKLMRCSRKVICISIIAGVFLFAMLTGAQSSSLRAAIMCMFVCLGRMLDRKVQPVNTLLFSALAITFFYPGQMFNPGFILSYTAVLSIIYITPITDNMLGIREGIKIGGGLNKIKIYILRLFSVSLSVWIGMMPLIALYFRILTPIVVLSNFVAVPCLMVIVVLGLGLFFAGFFHIFTLFAFLISKILDLLVCGYLECTRIMSDLPLAFVRVPAPNWLFVTAFYAFLVCTTILFKFRKSMNYAVLFALAALNLFVWNEVSVKPPDSLTVTFFNAGKADATLFEFPDGSTMLVDGGSAGGWGGVACGKEVIAPYLYQRGIRNIDCILVTHLHEDHFGGIIHIINNFKVGTLIDNGDIFYDEKYQNNILDAAKKKSIKRLIVKKNDIIKGFEKFDIIVLNPGKNGGYRSINDSSIVIKCIDKSSEGSMLLSGDIEEAAIEKILCFDNVLKSDVIKMPHHGQSDCGLLIEKFLHTVNPRVAIITNKNTASINPELLRFLTSQNVDIRITGKSGFFVLQKNPEK